MTACKACQTPLPERHGRGKNNYCSRTCHQEGKRIAATKRRQYYFDNRDRILAKSVPHYARTKGIGQQIITMFSLLPEEDKPGYAEWVLTLANNEGRYRQAIGQWAVDELVGQYTDY